jgi:hypothetical protein
MYNEKDYMKIHRLVNKFKRGSSESGEKLLILFEPFINKYIKLIIYNEFNVKDNSIRQFLSLFFNSRNSGLNKSINNRRMPSVISALLETAEYLHNLLSCHGEDDIKQTIYLTILHMASLYKDKKPSFHNYIAKNFHFYFSRYIDKYYLGNISFAVEYIDNIPIPEDYMTIERLERALQVKKYNKSNAPYKLTNMCQNPYNDKVFDITWETGYTCDKRISHLTTFERRILVMYYVRGMTDEDIATECGFCRASINRKRLAAIRKARSGTDGKSSNQKNDYLQKVRKSC